MSRAWLLFRRFAEAFVGGALAGVVLLVLAPVAMGWRPYTVLTGSMRPVIQPGDVVMDRPITGAEIHVGDVVTFKDPSRGGKLVTHRVRSVAHGPATTNVETRGDANSTSEHWAVQTKDQVGKVVFVLPWIGHVAVLIRNPLGVLLLVVLPVLGLGFLAVRAIWREDDDEEEGTGGDGGETDAPGGAAGAGDGDGDDRHDAATDGPTAEPVDAPRRGDR